MKYRRFFSGVPVFKGIKKGSSIVCLFFHISSPACFSPARVKKQSRVDFAFITFSYRTCTTWKKRRSLRTNSFFAEYPKISLGELLLLIYFWSLDVTWEKTARMMSMNVNLVCQGLLAFRRSMLPGYRPDQIPFIPFGGTAVIKCNESKFNYKATKRNMVKPKLGIIGILGFKYKQELLV